MDQLLSCYAPLFEECLQDHGHKRDPEVTFKAFDVVAQKAEVILVWVKVLGIENAYHPE